MVISKDNPFGQTATLSPEQKKTLQDQEIDENGPGTILRDFEMMLGRIEENRYRPSPAQCLLPLGALADLNASLCHPIRIDLKRPRLKSYPHLHGLYLLSRLTGLVVLSREGKRRVLAVSPEVRRSWKSLNPTERYFNLLEAWLLRDRPEVVGEQRSDHTVLSCANFMQQKLLRRLPVAGNKAVEGTINYYPGLLNLALLELFGIISIEHADPDAGKGWKIRHVEKTRIGDALIPLFRTAFEDAPEGLYSSVLPDFGEWQAIFRPYFPRWRENLITPQASLQKGNFVFKVSLGKGIWRRIAVSGGSNLEVLSDEILDAFDFDNDHLYEFICRDQYGLERHIASPECQERPSAMDLPVGQLPLGPGDEMDFLYDFGTGWKFNVLLEKIDSTGKDLKSPEILESRGKAPDQYPDW